MTSDVLGSFNLGLLRLMMSLYSTHRNCGAEAMSLKSKKRLLSELLGSLNRIQSTWSNLDLDEPILALNAMRRKNSCLCTKKSFSFQEKKFSCKICALEFGPKADLREHLKSHSQVMFTILFTKENPCLLQIVVICI